MVSTTACPVCGGDGWVVMTHDPLTHHWDGGECPHCDGRGYVVDVESFDEADEPDDGYRAFIEGASS